ncbi:MAG: NAD(P)-dependent oxidoreductase, partial [Terriglobia bacterium]
MKNVLVDMEPSPKELTRLRAIAGIEVRLVDPENRPRPLPSDLIRDIHILLCTFPPTNFAEMKSLELIQLASAGYGQLYGLPMAELGVRACNGRGIFDVAIAEWNIAMMVNLARNLRTMIRNQEAGVWDRSPIFQREIRGLVAGIWGYGGIGRETARLAKALGLTVQVMSRTGVRPSKNVYHVPGTGDPEGRFPDRVYVTGQETEFLAGLDFLILSLPLTKSTEGIVGERELQILPRSAFVLNPARGPLIKEQALLAALREGWIAGAALDT